MSCWLTKSGKNGLDGSLFAIPTLSANGLDDQYLEQKVKIAKRMFQKGFCPKFGLFFPKK
jgi:hypothetical protein